MMHRGGNGKRIYLSPLPSLGHVCWTFFPLVLVGSLIADGRRLFGTFIAALEVELV